MKTRVLAEFVSAEGARGYIAGYLDAWRYFGKSHRKPGLTIVEQPGNAIPIWYTVEIEVDEETNPR